MRYLIFLTAAVLITVIYSSPMNRPTFSDIFSNGDDSEIVTKVTRRERTPTTTDRYTKPVLTTTNPATQEVIPQSTQSPFWTLTSVVIISSSIIIVASILALGYVCYKVRRLIPSKDLQVVYMSTTMSSGSLSRLGVS
uniref:Col_cuticle_N domain-containing protein n=1 Tax=Steinernema glaseri TaxID=37863 RepID=A0A1I8AFI5_9BILA